MKIYRHGRTVNRSVFEIALWSGLLPRWKEEEMIKCFSDFCDELLKCGFSMGGGNSKGIYAIIDFGWNAAPSDSPIRWHTGDPETDPWEWRMRILEERRDIAYGKVFFGASGYITREWYPLFLAVRRNGMVFDEWYDEGKASQLEKKLYEAVSENGHASVPDLKRICNIHREDASLFDRALVNLQKNLFITMCGHARKKNRSGEEYGWNSTVFTTVEDFWEKDLSPDLSPDEAYRKIRGQILKLNPKAQEKDIRKFIRA